MKKITKYAELKKEISRKWGCSAANVKVVPSIIGALGLIPKKLTYSPDQLDIRTDMRVLQKSALLATEHFLRKVFSVWGLLLRLDSLTIEEPVFIKKNVVQSSNNKNNNNNAIIETCFKISILHLKPHPSLISLQKTVNHADPIVLLSQNKVLNSSHCHHHAVTAKI